MIATPQHKSVVETPGGMGPAAVVAFGMGEYAVSPSGSEIAEMF